jgi:hypothetical protein
VLRLRSVRFEQPYVHTVRVPGEAEDRTLSIQQAPFNAEGFASTGTMPGSTSTFLRYFAPLQTVHSPVDLYRGCSSISSVGSRPNTITLIAVAT